MKYSDLEYGLIGEKLGHSWSREIHHKLSSRPYDLCEVPKDELDLFFRQSSFRGINVTIPYKQAVIPYLDSISPVAESIGSVNTIVRKKEGLLYGYNTDFPGFDSLAKHARIAFSGKNILILGNGGTAKTVSAVTLAAGAKSVTFAVRQVRGEDQVLISDLERDPQLRNKQQIIVNATPVGMSPDDEERLLDLPIFPNIEGVLDCIYNPLRTNLVLEARQLGLKAEGGLYMLLVQACFAQELFQDRVNETLCDIEKTESLYNELLRDKENIVLTGMPSSGKSAIGAIIANRLGREHFDTDKMIEEQTGTDITTIFLKKGEKGFREFEKIVIQEVSMRQGVVISTGGGCVLEPLNIHRLKRNGRIYLLDRDLDLLISSKDRPLASDREQLLELYAGRKNLYLDTADAVIDNNDNIEDAVERLLEAHFQL
jgi:shikimate dehydrogenase